jgi:Fe-S-cluster containining protein
LLSLTLQDVARIAVGLGVPPSEFCHLEPRSDDWRSPPILIADELHFLMLNSGPLKPCVFLHTMTKERRCAIYGLRPMTCRLYPFKWEQGDMISGPRVVWCPQGWLLTPQARKGVEKTIRDSLREEIRSTRLIEAFPKQKKHPATAQGFFDYAVEQGSELLGLDPSTLFRKEPKRSMKKRLW